MLCVDEEGIASQLDIHDMIYAYVVNIICSACNTYKIGGLRSQW